MCNRQLRHNIVVLETELTKGVFRHFLDIAHDDNALVSIDAICKWLNVKYYVLHRLCRDKLNMSPTEYIRYVKLLKIRHALTQHSTESISELSKRFGFHANLAHWYKMEFGELPSQTLRNKA